MGNKTRIVVLRKRELIYTGIFAALAITLVVLLFLMFRPQSDGSSDTGARPIASSKYKPGVYTTPVSMGGHTVDVEVTVDADQINGVRLVNLDEAGLTMYPLVEPAMEHIASQICETQSLEGLTCPEGSQYTSQVLVNAVSEALEKAEGTVEAQ